MGMTYRERREGKAERLQGWAEKRQTRAAEVLSSKPEMRHDWAFITQPGHIPERARMIARDERAFESLAKAREMASRAAGIESQLAESIYSDDPDALEALEARIARLEAQRDGIKAANAAYRKAHRAELAGMSPYQRDQALPHQGYELTNLSGNIKRNRDRLEGLRIDRRRLERCEAAGGVAVEPAGAGWVCVTFAEKPAGEVLDALREAGFSFRRGSWWGKADAVPAEVRS